MATYIVTGCLGFIGSAATHRLLKEGHKVIGIDNFSGGYPTILRDWRLDRIQDVNDCDFDLIVCNLVDEEQVGIVMQKQEVDGLFHFAAVPGVRRSFEEPELYVETNMTGTLNILEWAGQIGIPKLVLASSSSVYGNLASVVAFREIIPCKEEDMTDQLLSPYAVTKRAMELLAYPYHLQYGYDVIIPRYFTVYGPAGRPDMACLWFIWCIENGLPIEIYGDGYQKRDFTYIADVVDGTVRMMDLEGFHILNIGSGNPITVNEMVKVIADKVGRNPLLRYASKKMGDVDNTYADIRKAEILLSWKPYVRFPVGIARTVEWFREFKGQIYDSSSATGEANYETLGSDHRSDQDKQV